MAGEVIVIVATFVVRKRKTIRVHQACLAAEITTIIFRFGLTSSTEVFENGISGWMNLRTTRSAK